MVGSCFDCLYQDIRETAHEWIECFCRDKNNENVGLKYSCDSYSPMPDVEEKIVFVCDLLNDYKEPGSKHRNTWDAERYLIEKILRITTDYLITKHICITGGNTNECQEIE